MRRLPLLLPALLLGCTPAPGDDDDDDGAPDWGYELDPDVHSVLPEGYRADDPARVIFLGDSITDGAGASEGSMDYPSLLTRNDDDGWPDWGDHDLRTLYGDIDVVDVSRGGATTRTLVQDQLPSLSGELGASVDGVSLVVMTIGGNDMQAALLPILNADDQDAVADERIGAVADNMHTTIDYFEDEDRFPDGVRVYFANVYEPSDDVGVSDCFFGIDYSTILRYFEQANTTMRGVAEERGTAMVDMRGHFLGHGVYAGDDSLPVHHPDDPSEWFASDCIHPNDRGHHELRRLFHTAIDGRPLEAPGEVP